MAVFFLLGVVLLAFVNLERHRNRLNQQKAAEPSDDVIVDIPAGYLSRTAKEQGRLRHLSLSSVSDPRRDSTAY
jgi:hypothetical protein